VESEDIFLETAQPDEDEESVNSDVSDGSVLS
jgi:hypothetical protein